MDVSLVALLVAMRKSEPWGECFFNVKQADTGS